MTRREAWLAAFVLLTACAHAPSSDTPTQYSLNKVDEQPRLISCSLPQGGNASVYVLFNLDAAGTVHGAKVEQRPRMVAEGKEAWASERALAVINSCRFNPAKLKDSPVAVRDVRWVVVVSI